MSDGARRFCCHIVISLSIIDHTHRSLKNRRAANTGSRLIIHHRQTRARAHTYIHYYYYYYNTIFVRLCARCVRRDLMIFREPELIHIVLCVVYIVTVSLLWLFFSFFFGFPQGPRALCLSDILEYFIDTMLASNNRRSCTKRTPSVRWLVLVLRRLLATYSLFNVFGAQRYYTDPFVRGRQKNEYGNNARVRLFISNR